MGYFVLGCITLGCIVLGCKQQKENKKCCMQF